MRSRPTLVIEILMKGLHQFIRHSYEVAQSIFRPMTYRALEETTLVYLVQES